MKRPEPKSEIVVQQFGEFLAFELASEDAARWLDREAPPFMSAYVRGDGSMTATAYVRKNFDPTEVAAYLRQYGAE